jgi:signal transduction histidine kinase
MLATSPAAAPGADLIRGLLTARRSVVAALLVGGVVGLHALAAWFFADDRAFASPPHVVLFFVELPFAMFAMSMTYRWSLRQRRGWPFRLLATLTASLGLAVLTTTLTPSLMSHLAESAPMLHGSGPVPNYAFTIMAGAKVGLVQWIIWAISFVYPYAAEEARLREQEAERLRGWAELALLKSQLEPHFLLNTLNAIAGLVTEDPREARRLLACLGELLSDAVRETAELHSVNREVTWLRRYAEILESRYHGSLEFRWEVANDTEAAQLPRLLLQPLVENAVKHGALSRDGDGRVVTTISRVRGPSGDRLVCCVEDNGLGAPDAPPRSEALGLRAVQRRLELKYEDATLRLQSSPNGTKAVVELPLTLGAAS